MKFYVLVLLACATLIVGTMLIADDAMIKDLLKIRVGGFSLDNARIADFGRQLSIASGLSVCIEEAPIVPGVEKSESEAADLKTKTGDALTLIIPDGSVANAIEILRESDNRYTFSADPELKVINIYPAHDSPLDWQTDAIVIDEMTVSDLFAKDILGLRKHGISFDPGRGNLSWLKSKISLDSKPVKAREAINLICGMLEFHARWEVVNVLHAYGDTKYILTFHGINPPVETGR